MKLVKITFLALTLLMTLQAKAQVMMSGTVVEKGSKAAVADANIIFQNPEGNNWEGYSSIKELEQLKDSRNEFIENLLAAFERDHPEFIEHLKECGLDEEEIRYCCLEVLGIKDENL